MDENGDLIEGEVQLSFTEIHDAAEVILSGIPMNFTSETGEMGSFETAGMFDISGTANGKEVRIGNNKTIEIQMASNKQGDFNFYSFDENINEWQELSPLEAVVNEDKLMAKAAMGPETRKAD